MRILAGIETEYGLYIEGRGAEEQIEDSMALVRSDPNQGRFIWDYRYESPRADLRGFSVERLAFDPIDAQFDRGRTHPADREVRSDRIHPNGARFYNDHGHPEYATPECWSLDALARHDAAGERVIHEAARAFAQKTGWNVKIYKNNTDFHGASYGTHESYLVPRALGFERLYRSVMPMLIARTVLCGAGKVGTERPGVKGIDYQLSQRADFFVEAYNVETLWRRPVFNTRDEAHGDPRDWIRLHVIAGDANMIASCTRRKVGLVKLAALLAVAGEAPIWPIADPVRAFQSVSADAQGRFEIELERSSWTTVPEILESYFAAAESCLDLDDEMRMHIAECRLLLSLRTEDFPLFARSVDWAAKRRLLEIVCDEENLDWGDPALRAYDLEYHNVDPEEGLMGALREMNWVEPELAGIEEARVRSLEPSRARARGEAIRFPELLAASWKSLVFRVQDENVEIELDPARTYEFEPGLDLRPFLEAIR